MASRWVPARVITRRTKERKAFSPYLPLWLRRASTFGGNCAMAIAPWEADRAPSEKCLHRLTPMHSDHLRASRFRFLLLGGGASLRTSEGALHHRGAQDDASAGTTAKR